MLSAGFCDQVVTTNPIESVNAVLKRWTNFTASDMDTVMDELQACINDQMVNVHKAFLNLLSPYVVRPEFQQSLLAQSLLILSKNQKNLCDLHTISKVQIQFFYLLVKFSDAYKNKARYMVKVVSQ